MLEQKNISSKTLTIENIEMSQVLSMNPELFLSYEQKRQLFKPFKIPFPQYRHQFGQEPALNFLQQSNLIYLKLVFPNEFGQLYKDRHSMMLPNNLIERIKESKLSSFQRFTKRKKSPFISDTNEINALLAATFLKQNYPNRYNSTKLFNQKESNYLRSQYTELLNHSKISHPLDNSRISTLLKVLYPNLVPSTSPEYYKFVSLGTYKRLPTVNIHDLAFAFSVGRLVWPHFTEFKKSLLEDREYNMLQHKNNLIDELESSMDINAIVKKLFTIKVLGAKQIKIVDEQIKFVYDKERITVTSENKESLPVKRKF